jgi:hypothetical protein
MLERRGVFDGELHRVDIARISVASAPTVAPMSYLASALASARTSIRIPSTLDDAIASVRKSWRANGSSAGRASAFNAAIAPSASETTPARSPDNSTSRAAMGSGMNAS